MSSKVDVVTNVMNEYFARMTALKALGVLVGHCRDCEGLNIPGATESAVGYGNPLSTIMLVGQSLCTQCMDTGVPFTRGSGDQIDLTCKKTGTFRSDLFITNVLHCHPTGNRKSKKEEIESCRSFLLSEIKIVRPYLLIALGADAKKAIFSGKIPFEGLPAANTNKDLPADMKLMWMYHPAYYLYKGDMKGMENWSNKLADFINQFLVKPFDRRDL